MGHAARMAAKHNITACSRCERPWGGEVRLMSIEVWPEVGNALCRQCRLEEMAERVLRDE